MTGTGRSELSLRIISAAVLIPGVLALDWVGGVAFDIMVTVLAVLMAIEWDRLMNAGSERPESGKVLRAGIGLSATAAIVTAWTGFSYQHLGGAPELPVVVVILLSGFVVCQAEQIVRRRPRVWLRAMGVIYIGVPTVAFIVLRHETDGALWILWLFIAVWATDIGAYAAGRSIGGPKLAPGISPNKTWSGAIGGAAAAVVLSAPLSMIMDGFDLTLAIPAALAISVVSQCGDLMESAVKRHLNVKDSGTIIPGHGGLFDRLDGLLAAAPLALAIHYFLVSPTTA